MNKISFIIYYNNINNFLHKPIKNMYAYIMSKNTDQINIPVNGWKYWQYWVYHDYVWKDDNTLEVKGTYFLL